MSSNRRAKIAATATVLGLGALGGVALGTNPGVPAVGQQSSAANPSAAIVTSASGAAAATVPVATTKPRSTVQKPIVTRASGGGPNLAAAIDD